MTALYTLPWTIENNPNGWIEPTTYCQLKCPGCYRGLAEDNPKRIHQSLQEMKRQVDWFITHRNVQTISIAGGEPLCYPSLMELVSYIASLGLKTKIYSNGIALTEKKLFQLKQAGVTEIIIHLDKFQKKHESEEEVNLLREVHCQMFRKVRGVNLGFILPISKGNVGELSILADFFKKNSDIVSLIVFTIYREMLPNKLLHSDQRLSMKEISDAVQASFGIEYCARLGKKLTAGESWLLSLSAYNGKKFFGSFDADFYYRIQKRYFKRNGKYFITVANKPMKSVKLMRFILNKSVHKILLNALRRQTKTLNTQSILIIDPPEFVSGGWDLCVGCPDAMLHQGKLVPSCLLERISAGEKVIAH